MELALLRIKTYYKGTVIEFDDGSWIQRTETANLGEESSGTFPLNSLSQNKTTWIKSLYILKKKKSLILKNTF